MKILFVANLAKEHINKFHIPTIEMLISEGWTVEVATRLDEPIKASCRSYDLPISRSPFHTNWPKAYKYLKSLIDKNDYDIVYCHTSVGATLARLAAKSKRSEGMTKVLKFAHGTYFYRHAPWYNWVYYPLYKYLARYTDGIITITKEDYLFSLKHFSNAQIFMVNGIGIDTSRFSKQLNPEEKKRLRTEMKIPEEATVLIYCAELIKNKNQKLLLEALEIALAKKDDLYLVLAGIDHFNGKYHKMAESLGISDHVRFLGWRNDIVELYQMSDICVASSIREGFGLNIVEAMFCGLPVIASNNSGHTSIIENGKNGFIVELENPQEFANKITLLSDSREIRERIVKNANANINRYTSPEILKELYSIFSKISNR